MACVGKAKWEKYFSAGGVETLVKTDTELLTNDGVRQTVKRGTPVLVLPSSTYSSRLQVLIGTQHGTMKLADIDKPFKTQSGQLSLKPDQLKLAITAPLADWRGLVKSTIDNHPEVDELATYLKALVDHAAHPSSKAASRAAQVAFRRRQGRLNPRLIGSIGNDFLEVLGPFFASSVVPGAETIISFPQAGNAPLFDFSMRNASGLHRFSSKKAGSRTNTLKVTELILACEVDQTLKAKYAREHELMTIIQTTSIRQAPAAISSWLSQTFKKTWQPPAAATDPISAIRLEAAAVKFINEQPDLNFDELAAAALSNLWYVRAKINQDGTLCVAPLQRGSQIRGLKFRTKNSGVMAVDPAKVRFNDRIGFAV